MEIFLDIFVQNAGEEWNRQQESCVKVLGVIFQPLSQMLATRLLSMFPEMMIISGLLLSSRNCRRHIS